MFTSFFFGNSHLKDIFYAAVSPVRLERHSVTVTRHYGKPSLGLSSCLHKLFVFSNFYIQKRLNGPLSAIIGVLKLQRHAATVLDPAISLRWVEVSVLTRSSLANAGRRGGRVLLSWGPWPPV